MYIIYKRTWIRVFIWLAGNEREQRELGMKHEKLKCYINLYTAYGDIVEYNMADIPSKILKLLT